MSITTTAGATFTADASYGASYTGLTGTIGVEIQDGAGNIVTARTTVGIVEAPAGSGIYTKNSLVAPNSIATYEVVWDTGGVSPVFAVEDLIVAGGSSAGLSAGALVTVAAAQAWLRRNHATGQSELDDVTLLTITINGVSEAIRRYTGRQYIPETGVAKTFEYDGSGFLNFAPYELRSITSATLGGEVLTVTTGAGDGDYVPMPRNKTSEGTYLYWITRGYFRLGPSHFIYSPVLKTRDVVITGDWGMPAVPADIQLACLIAVADMYRNPEQSASRGAGEFQLVEEPRAPGSAGLPDGVVELIEPYKRYHL